MALLRILGAFLPSMIKWFLDSLRLISVVFYCKKTSQNQKKRGISLSWSLTHSSKKTGEWACFGSWRGFNLPHPPPPTRPRRGSSFFSAWLDLSQRCHWQSSLYLWLLLYVRVSPERGTHKLCSLLGSGLAETDRIDWWVGMGTRRESERCPRAR